MRTSLSVCLFLFLAAAAPAQNLELSAGGVIPINGYIANNYKAGPAGHIGFEFLPSRYFGVEAGWTGAGLPGLTTCRYGCEYSRETVHFFDAGIRGHLPLANNRVDLSLGVGGGYVWFEHYNYYKNQALLQYSGRATVALDHRNRFRLAFTLRTWRDLGRPTQQWLSPTAGIIYCFR